MNEETTSYEFRPAGSGSFGFLDEEGTFPCILAGKKCTKFGTLICYFVLDDGRRICAMAWEDTDYYGLDRIRPGTRLDITFRRSRAGKNYLRGAEVAEDNTEVPWEEPETEENA